MHSGFSLFVGVWTQVFFIFTPFFAMTMLLSMTQTCTEAERRQVAYRVAAAVAVLCTAVFFFGGAIFSLFGVTLDAFRVGSGALLFLSAVELVQAKTPRGPSPAQEDDFAVVPLAMPIVVGPAVVGTLFVLASELANPREKAIGAAAVILAVLALLAMLLIASAVERVLGRRRLNIISKLTGLIVAAIAAQMVLQGIRNFLSA